MPQRLKRRRLPEEKNLIVAIVDTINAHLVQRALLMRKGTIAETTIVAAPSPTQKGNQ